MIDVKDNWRILLLVALCIVAALALFGPLGASGPDIDIDQNETEVEQFEDEDIFTDPTNLQYGLELSGGARIRGQLVGMTAEEVGLEEGDTGPVTDTLTEELGLDPIDIRVREGPEEDTVEVFDGNVTEQEVADALQVAGFDVEEGDVSQGVTDSTIDEAVDTLTDRLDQTGLGGTQVATSSAVTGDTFIVAEAPGIGLQQLNELVTEAGRVQILAGYPGEDGELEITEAASGPDIAAVDAAQREDAQGPNRVPITLESDSAESFAQLMNDKGFTTVGEGVERCNFDVDEDDDPRDGDTEDWDQWCLYTVVDDEIVYGASMGGDLAESIAEPNEDWLNNPSFVLQTGTGDEGFQQAQNLEINLRAGELPTDLSVESESFISPSLAQLFIIFAIITALMAWLTVCVVVYYWYRDIRVAVPMLVTAATEVFLLLGFAAAIGMALDLSHIAGFIAVIGTGLDDLIIMADEILQRKQKVQTGRVFQSRFRKAFWIIGMAAATTIIAMSPLAVLSLGDLRGFAIVTIVGVLIGVGITRPAYGDVLRHLMLDDVKRK